MAIETQIASGYNSKDVDKAIRLYETTGGITDDEIKNARELFGDLKKLINGDFTPNIRIEGRICTGIKFGAPIKLDGSDQKLIESIGDECYGMFVESAHRAREHLDIIKRFKPEMERYTDVPAIVYRVIKLSEAEELMEAALVLVKL